MFSNYTVFCAVIIKLKMLIRRKLRTLSAGMGLHIITVLLKLCQCGHDELCFFDVPF